MKFTYWKDRFIYLAFACLFIDKCSLPSNYIVQMNGMKINVSGVL